MKLMYFDTVGEEGRGRVVVNLYRIIKMMDSVAIRDATDIYLDDGTIITVAGTSMDNVGHIEDFME